MLALVLDGSPRLVRDHASPRRAPGEALVRMRLAGVCDTDLQLAAGYMSYRGVLGHEFVGEVLEADDPAWQGRRIVADINAGCGRCADCREADGHHCRERTVLGIVGRDGALAELLVVPERNLVAVPDSMPDEAAVFAEPAAAALHVLDGIPNRNERVVVLGDGKLGQLIVRALLWAKVPVALVGRHDHKLALAAELGAETVSEAQAGSLEGSSTVVEATGSETGIELALRLTRPRGTVVLKTTVASAPRVDWSPVVINELTIAGSRCGDLERAVDMLARGGFDPAPLIHGTYPLHRADEALTRAAERGTLKVLVKNRAN